MAQALHTHFESCSDVTCHSAGQLELNYKQARCGYDDDLLFKQTNDLVILMKKNMRLRHSAVCLQELMLFANRLLWTVAGTSRLYKKLIQIIVLIEKLDTEELVQNVLCKAWDKLERALMIDSSGLSENDFIHLSDSQREQTVCAVSTETESSASQETATSPFNCLAVWSTLMDGVSAARRIVKPRAEWLVGFVSLWLAQDLKSERNLVEEEYVYTMTKLLLQSCQLVEDVSGFSNGKETTIQILQIINASSSDVTHMAPSVANDKHPFLRAILSAIAVLRAEHLRKDCRLLAGSIVTYILSMLSIPSEIISLSVALFKVLGNSQGVVQASSCNDHLTSLTFGQLSLLHGLFAYMDDQIFSHPCHHLALLSDSALTEENQIHLANDKTSEHKPGGSYINLSEVHSAVCVEKDMNPVVSPRDQSSKDDEFRLHEAPPTCHDRPFLFVLFETVCQFCHWQQEKFHSFKLLELWFKKLMQLHQSVDHGTSLFTRCDLLEPNGAIVKQTMGILLAHLDDSVDGVSDSITHVIVTLIRLKPRTNNAESILGLWLLDQSFLMPWCVRARYILMAAILEHLSLETVSERCHLIMDDVCRCLATNYLTPSAAQVHQCILNIFSKQPNGCELWKEFCWPYLLSCLTSENSLTSRNASQYLFVATLKTLSDSLNFMLADIKGKTSNRIIYAHLAILSAARKCDLPVDMVMENIQGALRNQNNDLRLLAFDLLCTSPRTTDPLKLFEVELLQQFLPLNMNIDSPPFRKQLQTCLHSALVRGRDASLSKVRLVIKRGQHIPEEVVLATEFVDWMWNLCLHNIRPGGSFQRIQTALSWARTILDTFVLRSRVTARKGLVPPDINLLTSWAEESNRCQFFSKMATNRLVSCLFNDIDEISEMAAEILLFYFPWPMTFCIPQLHLHKELDLTPCDLLSTAVQLCHSPRVRDCESGSVLCGLLFEKSVIANGDQYVISSLVDGVWQVSYGGSNGNTECSIVEFLSQLLNQVAAGIELASSKPLEAAMSNPVQGILGAIRRCLSRSSFRFETYDLFRPIVEKVISHMSDLIELILNIFGGRLTADKTAPSFEQISQSIKDVIGESLANEDPDSVEGIAVLTPEHQLMNTWCYLNIKEASLLLGQLVAMMLRPGRPGSDTLLTAQEVNEIGEIFLRVLTCCRHRGAIEGACLGFSQFCSALFRTMDVRIQSVPQALLQKVLSRVDDLSEASLTRRSAGLPLVIQTILANEAKVKKTTLFSWTIEMLLGIVSKPLLSITDEQRDLPQVHAINIITAIVRESSVAGVMSTYLDRLTVEALKSFISPIWAMRNAAMQLFGYLLSRLVGEKKVLPDDLQTTTVTEFVSLFPSLCKFMLSVLQSAVKQFDTPDTRVLCDPTLVPILSILARLSQGLDVDRCNWFIDEVRDLVLALSRHQLFAVRYLVAKALVPLVSQKHQNLFLQNLVERLPASRSEVNSFNHLHGQLLQLQGVLASSCQRSCDLTDFTRVLLSRNWILASENPCPLVRSEFLRLTTSVYKVAQETSDADMCCLIQTKLESQLQNASVDIHQQLGAAVWIEQVVFAWLTISDECGLVDRVIFCLTSDNLDVLSSCLSWLSACRVDRLTLADASIIQACLWQLVTLSQPWKVLCNILEVLHLFYQRHDGLGIPDECSTILDVLMMLLSSQPNSSHAAICISVSAFIIRHWTLEKHETRFSLRCISWIELVCNCCTPVQPSNIRLSAAVALQVAAPGLLDVAMGNQSENEWINPTARLIWTILLLLNDEQVEIRETASRIVKSLDKTSQKSSELLHFNQAIEIFLDSTAAAWCSNMAFSCEMYGLLVSDDFVTTLSQELNNRYRGWELFKTEDANPFLEHEFLACRLSLVLKRQDFSSQSNNLLTWLLCEVSRLESNIGKIMELLQSFESDILVVLANRKMFAGLCVIIHVSDLLLKWTNDVLTNGSTPTSSLTSSSSSLPSSSSSTKVSAELELGKGRLETLRHSLISKRPPSAAGTGAAALNAGSGTGAAVPNAGSVSVENFPCIVDDRYYLRRMKEILQDGLPKPSPPGQLDRVSGHVFIGNQRNADDTTGLRSDGIDHVLSCAASRRSTDSPYDGDSGIIDYFLIPAEDREDFDITRYFDAAFLFLDRVKRRRGKVLVHCNMGVNRSGAVVAAYLMVDEKRNLLDVVSYLKGKRRLVLSNKGFRRQLVQFARSRGLLDPVVDTVTRISYMGDGKKGTYEADEDEQRRPPKRQEREKMADGEAADGKNSLRKLMRELEEELRNGNGDVNKWSKMENEKEKRNRNEKKLETPIDAVVQNGVDSSPRHLAIAETISTKLVTNAEPSRKFSSSVQYWPAVADPVRASTPGTSNDNIMTNGELPDEKIVVTKKRRSLRSRKDVEKSNPEPQKTTTSTVFCTLRAKPKRNIEVRKRGDLADDVNKLEINNAHPINRFNDFPPIDFPSSSTTFAQEEVLSSTLTLRTRCLSSTAVDRPTSVVGAEAEINGFLVLLGKKIVHAKSSSQWNLTTQDREPAANFLTSELRHSRVITRSRTNLNEIPPLSVSSSFGGPSWQSVEKISSTARNTNVFVVRKDKKETFFANN